MLFALFLFGAIRTTALVYIRREDEEDMSDLSKKERIKTSEGGKKKKIDALQRSEGENRKKGKVSVLVRRTVLQ